MENSKGKTARNYNLNKHLEHRFDETISFLKKHIKTNDKILDIGERNLLSDYVRKEGYSVVNTPEKIDLDNDYSSVAMNVDCVTAFEILEHLVSPYPLLKNIKAPKLIVSVPLNLWFTKAYWNEDDPYDRHYHEFEPRQLDMLLEKAGWEIKASKKWKTKLMGFGIRPLLRLITDRYYIVYAERK